MADEKVFFEFSPSSKMLIPFALGKALLWMVFIFFLFGGLSLFLLLPVLVFSFVWNHFLLKTFRYKVTDKGVYSQGGILMKENKFVPFFKVTDTVVSQDIVSQLFGVWTVGIQTAGAGGNNVPEIQFFGVEDPAPVEDKVRVLIEQNSGRKRALNE